MKHRIAHCLLALMLTVPAAAFAALDALEQAYELSLADVQLPHSTTGRTVVRACEGCDEVVLRVEPATTYHVRAGGEPVSLADFKAVAANMERSQLITVFYSTSTLAVTRLVVSPVQ